MKVQIQTTQNVTLEYEVADLGHRIGATLIDWFILTAYVVGVAVTYPLLVTSGDDESFALVMSTIVFLPLILYNLGCELFLNGQTIGKRTLGIRVVRLDGRQPTLGGYLMRWILGFVEIYLFMGIPAMIGILMSDKGQRIGDRAAGTTVVRTRPAATLDDTIFVPVSEDYEPTFVGVTRLTDSDVAVIKEVIDSSTHSQNATIVSTLSGRVEEVIGSTTELPPLVFLRTVVNDYNHITSRL